jgi:cytochrome c-type biogenesis protein CcmE
MRSTASRGLRDEAASPRERQVKPRHKRIAIIAGGLAAIAVAAGLILAAFQQNLVFFFTPSQVAANEAPQGKTFRIGGMVETGSVSRQPDGLTVRFTVTDTAKSIPVTYRGALPDLFREGKGVVAQGRIGADGVFQASEVLAKHDENYMPPEAAEAVKRAHDTARKASQTVVGGEKR